MAGKSTSVIAKYVGKAPAPLTDFCFLVTDLCLRTRPTLWSNTAVIKVSLTPASRAARGWLIHEDYRPAVSMTAA